MKSAVNSNPKSAPGYKNIIIDGQQLQELKNMMENQIKLEIYQLKAQSFVLIMKIYGWKLLELKNLKNKNL